MCHIVTRKRAPTDPPDDTEAETEKKERVIHTRVPESLEAELRERAQGLGISVSNLVRNVLGHAFGLVGDVVADSHAIARAARGGDKKPAAPVGAAAPASVSIEDVLGWQPIVLGKNAVCAKLQRAVAARQGCRGRCRHVAGRVSLLLEGAPLMTNQTSTALAVPDPTTDPRTLLAQLLSPLRETAAAALRLLAHLGRRLDAFSLDLARDLGAVTREVQALATATHGTATTALRATPRAARLAQVTALLFAKHKWLRLAAAARGDAGLRDKDHRALARQTAAIAATLRGGIAKLGQLASCRPDLVGPIWASELAKLQDDVPPVDTASIRARIEAELGKPIAEVYATFDDTPLAAASLAQVHAATLLDGTAVAVKVQVPGIEDIIAADIAALRTVARALGDVPGIDLAMLADELSRALDRRARLRRGGRGAAHVRLDRRGRAAADRHGVLRPRPDDDQDRRQPARGRARCDARGHAGCPAR